MKIRTLEEKASFIICRSTPIDVQNDVIGHWIKNHLILANPRNAGEEAVHYIDKKGVERIKMVETTKKIISEDFDCIPADHCRCCKNKIKPYDKKYYANKTDGNWDYQTLYCMANGYCEPCAKKKGIDTRRRPVYAAHTETYQLTGDDYSTTVTTYEDGSVEESNDGWALNRQKL